ncbi:MAG: phenylalanine--tRNA ligase subunit beta, partial [Actinomycetota bacterium]
MRAPLSWLREFVTIDAEPGALAERLSLSGLTVDEVIRAGTGVGGVVVAEVRAIAEHPDADNLVLVRAFDGEVERDIVCGARNFAVGDRVPLALPGANLPGGIEIGRRTVRGKTSDGMLCSARELHVSDDHSGILILDADTPLGKDIAGEIDDVVFDFDITTNRGDLLSIAGIAREIGALYGL